MARFCVLVTGDRNWIDVDRVNETLHPSRFDSNTQSMGPTVPTGPMVTVIHGGCHGLDLIAANVSKIYGYVVEEFPAEWGKYGKGAGPIRNKQMLDRLLSNSASTTRIVLAYHNDISSSKGTKNMISQVLKTDVPVFPHIIYG
jgi:hypothetical protein